MKKQPEKIMIVSNIKLISNTSSINTYYNQFRKMLIDLSIYIRLFIALVNINLQLFILTIIDYKIISLEYIFLRMPVKLWTFNEIFSTLKTITS